MMKRLLIVIDMQNDFVTGTLGSPQAEKIVPAVREKIEDYKKRGYRVIFTRDTHGDDYLQTLEGKYLPVAHCIFGTTGHQIIDELDATDCEIIDKPTFGSPELAKMLAADGTCNRGVCGDFGSCLDTDYDADYEADCETDYDEIELCGVCTDICVISNALIIKAYLPETKISVDSSCCAGTTEEAHAAALLAMKSCHIDIA